MTTKDESNLVRHAREELERITENDEYDEYDKWWINGMLRVVQAFADMEHSGASASSAISQLNALLRFKPLTPITNDPKEWVEVDDGLWQNRRDSEAFSKDGGLTYRLNSSQDVLHTSWPAK